MIVTLLRPDDTEERCGLILDDGTIVEIENIAEDKTKSFEMNPNAVVGVLSTRVVTGTWHTHPNESPNLSGADHDTFLVWPEFEHFIIGIDPTTKEICALKFRVEDGVVYQCD